MSNALTNLASKNITIGKFRLAETGLVVDGEPTYEEWEMCGEFLKQAEKAVQFWIGDWLNYGERKWGEMYSQAVLETGRDEQTLMNFKWVANAVPFSLRKENLSFQHHMAVAPLPPEQQKKLLDKAADDGMSYRELRQEVAKERIRGFEFELESNLKPEGKYRVIYADPPWKYTSGDQHSTEEQETVLSTHYPSMSIEELCGLPIAEMAADNSVLFMWVTSPLLQECFAVIKAWGFEYKASVVWNKEAHNVGHYVSVRHEFLLICTRGSCKPDIDRLLPSVVSEKRTEHSVKPETFRKMIDTMYPRGKRIELFARRPADGWKVWGNEVA